MRVLTVADGFQTIKISRLILGTMYFGTKVSQVNAERMMDRYLDAGGNLLDTAHCYANWLAGCGDGTSEASIGRWLQAGGRRNRVLLATKGGNTKRGVNPYRADLSETGLRRELEESLRALGTETVDLYWLHRDDPRIPAAEIIGFLNQLIQEGKVRMIGASNWKEERIAQANAFAKAQGLHGFAMSQIQFSLAECTEKQAGDATIVCMDTTRQRWYEQTQFPVAAFTAQAQGFFSKLIRDGAICGPEVLPESTRRQFYHAPNVRRLEAVCLLSEESGLTPTQIALAYLTSHPVRTAAVIGARTEAQLEDSLTAADVRLTAQQVRQLEVGDGSRVYGKRTEERRTSS